MAGEAEIVEKSMEVALGPYGGAIFFGIVVGFYGSVKKVLPYMIAAEKKALEVKIDHMQEHIESLQKDCDELKAELEPYKQFEQKRSLQTLEKASAK